MAASRLRRLLPPSTNAGYRGAALAAHVLAAFGVLTIAPGCIHTFLPDGGAATIAGLDLTRNGHVVVALFAWAGATQIAFGIAALVVALRYRTLVPLLLALALLERTLHAANAWLLDGGIARDHRPPEHYAVLIAVPLLAAALAMSVGDGRARSGS